jgi:hypothetical protein
MDSDHSSTTLTLLAKAEHGIAIPPWVCGNPRGQALRASREALPLPGGFQ